MFGNMRFLIAYISFGLFNTGYGSARLSGAGSNDASAGDRARAAPAVTSGGNAQRVPNLPVLLPDEGLSQLLPDEDAAATDVGGGDESAGPDGAPTEPQAEPELRFPMIDALRNKKQYMGAALVYLPTTRTRAAPLLTLMHTSKVKKHQCAENSWVPLTLTSSADQVTAASVKYELVGANTEVHEDVHFVHIALDIDYLIVPTKDFAAILARVGVPDGDKTGPESVARFSPDKLANLPEQIEMQFVGSKVVFALKRSAFTKCETVNHQGAQQTNCLLLMRPTHQEGWIVGKPLLDHVVSAVSVGRGTPFYNLCFPVDAVEDPPVTMALSGKTVSMPWTPNDYMYLVVVSILVVSAGLYLFGKYLVCCRGRRAAARTGNAETEPLITPSA